MVTYFYIRDIGETGEVALGFSVCVFVLSVVRDGAVTKHDQVLVDF